MVYALVDGSNVITKAHLLAALALVHYSEKTVAYIFGETLGDPIADKVLQALRDWQHPEMTKTELYEALGRNCTKTQLDRALDLLVAAGHIAVRKQGATGRPTEYIALCSSNSFTSYSSDPLDELIREHSKDIFTKETKKHTARDENGYQQPYEINEVDEETQQTSPWPASAVGGAPR